MGNASMLSGWKQFGLLTATFTAMLLTAKAFSKSEAKQERQPKTTIDGEARTHSSPIVSGESASAYVRVAPVSALVEYPKNLE